MKVHHRYLGIRSIHQQPNYRVCLWVLCWATYDYYGGSYGIQQFLSLVHKSFSGPLKTLQWILIMYFDKGFITNITVSWSISLVVPLVSYDYQQQQQASPLSLVNTPDSLKPITPSQGRAARCNLVLTASHYRNHRLAHIINKNNNSDRATYSVGQCSGSFATRVGINRDTVL